MAIAEVAAARGCELRLNSAAYPSPGGLRKKGLVKCRSGRNGCRSTARIAQPHSGCPPRVLAGLTESAMGLACGAGGARGVRDVAARFAGRTVAIIGDSISRQWADGIQCEAEREGGLAAAAPIPMDSLLRASGCDIAFSVVRAGGDGALEVSVRCWRGTGSPGAVRRGVTALGAVLVQTALPAASVASSGERRSKPQPAGGSSTLGVVCSAGVWAPSAYRGWRRVKWGVDGFATHRGERRGFVRAGRPDAAALLQAGSLHSGYALPVEPMRFRAPNEQRGGSSGYARATHAGLTQAPPTEMALTLTLTWAHQRSCNVYWTRRTAWC
jgi:hypothetical protein